MPLPALSLVFPGGEHPQALLAPGVSRIGSDPQAEIVLDRPGVQPRHCELQLGEHGLTLRMADGAGVLINGRAVEGIIAVRPGDIIGIATVQARLASLQATAPAATAATPRPAEGDVEATTVRPAMPRYVLRGVSGRSFGRSYPLVGATVLGRSPECSLRFEETGLSRSHAQLTPTADGVRIQDLGSTNGCFVNGRRVQMALAQPGDEVAFDTLRFRLLAPARGEAGGGAAMPPAAVPVPVWRRPQVVLGLMMAAVVLVAIAGLTLLR